MTINRTRRVLALYKDHKGRGAQYVLPAGSLIVPLDVSGTFSGYRMAFADSNSVPDWIQSCYQAFLTEDGVYYLVTDGSTVFHLLDEI